MNRYFSQLGRLAVVLLFALSVSACGGGGSGGEIPGGGDPPETIVDTSPDPVSFAVPVVETMAPGLALKSAPVFVRGIDEDISIPASVEGGLIAVNSETDFVEGPVEVRLDDRVLIRATAPDQFSASHTATLILGEGEDAQSADFTLATSASEFSVEPGLKSLTFKWDVMEGVSHFRLLENADGASGFTEVDLEIAGDAVEAILPGIPVHLTDWNNARYQLHACNGHSGCVSVPKHETSLHHSMSVEAIGLLKASNADPEDYFGSSVGVSADGRTMVVGAYGESSARDAGPGDNTAVRSGAAYIFEKDETGMWKEKVMLKGLNTEPDDVFGISVSISADGSIVAVGAVNEDSAAMAVGGNAEDNSAANAGAIYIFVRNDDDAWEQQAYLKASNADAGDRFGYPVLLNADGTRLVTGAYGEQSLADGVDADQADDSDPRTTEFGAGAIYVFSRDGGDWGQEAYIKASNSGADDGFGYALDMNDAGNIIAVGTYREDSGATGVNPDPGLDNAMNSGAVYLFENDGNAWSQTAYVKATNTDGFDHFGTSVALSRDGMILVVGADKEGSAAIGVNGDVTDNSVPNAGAAYVYSRSETGWTLSAYLKASNTDVGDNFGTAVAVNGDGSVIAVSAIREDSIATGINGDSLNEDGESVGAVYLFNRRDNGWAQISYLKPDIARDRLLFGSALSFSQTGDALFIMSYDNMRFVLPGESRTSDCDTLEPVNCAENSGGILTY